MDEWQKYNKKRLLSLNVQKDENLFCCIALTNPTEVVITSADGSNQIKIHKNGSLRTFNGTMSGYYDEENFR